MSDEAPPPHGPLKLRHTPLGFPVANPPASTPTTAPTDVAAHFCAATPAHPGVSAPPPPPAENDVHAILRDNLAAATAAGLNEVRPVVRRPSRRRRDYWLVLIGFNLLIVAFVLLPGPNVISMLFGFGGIVLFDLALTWIMWVVMDDY